ncbi:phosphopentomutase [Lactonifactor longoviformis]|uniref:Phosphopentomutase n=1 Tax=Lactonifactor longoviformis DSM 17459 TaxID=1122155 RepID=A0A1M4UFB5_9CLOT|nr:phosphopentomutase [Lactonifactor longoviformis]POP32150.1 phosphopentomutase [Lactonifactor longoviformis]SHE55459.1 phosphopentomutase [Lactonifactor longoviformis DSM 17459]
MNDKRVFLIVLDSFGIGAEPDADLFGDVGSNTLGTIVTSDRYDTPNMRKLGLFNIEGVTCGKRTEHPLGSFARMQEASMAKDTTAGHWEIAGLVSEKPFPTYPHGFPKEVLDAFSKATGRGVLCNKPYSGTDVIRDYGEEHMRTGDYIVYTSADSVFQIAAHEEIVPLDELYDACRKAREILQGEHGVGRVIARPFIGKAPEFKRTPHRHDFSLIPPKDTMLDCLSGAGLATIGVGKIYDIFAGKGISETKSTESNQNGMEITAQWQNASFSGLCFVNLVDFDMLYGHRNDIDGYAGAATEFDRWLGGFLDGMRENDILMITADHGCDPGTPSTDHSREYTPLLVCGKHVKKGVSLGTRKSFADIAATILDIFQVEGTIAGTSFLKEIEARDGE